MFTYSTCRDCGEPLIFTDADTVHPLCTPKPTYPELLAQEWLAAVEAGDEVQATQLQALIDEIDSAPPRFLDAALLYAAWGWPVFPLKMRQKVPATVHGFKDATTDVDQIRYWWTQRPNCNIGIATGHAFDVIDVDVPTGAQSFADLIAAQDGRTGHGKLPDAHGQVATASGGLHLFVRPTGKGNKAGLLPGIDYRGVGGYVVAPPSTLGVRGRNWSWTVKPSPTLTGGIR